MVKKPQEFNDIPVIEGRVWNENGLMEPNDPEIFIHVKTEITDEERFITYELKALMIKNETEEYLPFEKVN